MWRWPPGPHPKTSPTHFGNKYIIEVTSADGDTKKEDTLTVAIPSEVGYGVSNSLQAVSKTFDAGAT